ncbi:MAG: hypothetical protein HYY17_00720 [Planctomycetes bacterium]|nr:hypothetical protein [Planctomycetota bacterium]
MAFHASVAPGSGISWPVAVAVGVGVLALSAFAYRRALAIRDYGAWTPRFLLLLRIVAGVLLATLVVNPVVRFDRAQKESQRIVVLVDTSRSMSVRDTPGGATRLETAVRILDREKLLEKLSKVATVEVVAFDAGARPADLKQLLPAGEGSDLAGAVTRSREAKDRAALCATILFTDGCETGAASVANVPSGAPVYAVGLGSVAEALADLPDLAVTDVRVDRQALLHTQIEVRVTVRATNLAGQRAAVQIVRGEKVLAQQTVETGKGAQEVVLRFTAAEPGLFEFEAKVLPHPSEKIVENNSRFFAMRIMTQKLRVLYYEGTPRWSYKFLTRELKRDPNLAMDAFLRTNLDRGYQTGSAAGLPEGREALRRYDCVILGDVRGQDMTPAQAAALRDYVSEDGGGLVVLGGKESFAPSGLPALGLAALLPVDLAGAREQSGAFAVAPTPEGIVHPAFTGLMRFPPLDGMYSVGGVRAGAQVLAKAGDLPFAISHRYGTGRVFLCASDADWKWVMKHKDRGGDEVYVRFWGQVVRWTANRESEARPKGALQVATDKDFYRLGEAVKIRVQGEGSDAIAEAGVGGEKVPLQKGEGVYFPKNAGLHPVSAGEATCSFFVERTAAEFDRIALNDALLRQAAATSGGMYFDAVSAQRLPEALKASGRIRMEMIEFVTAESWIPFALVLVILAVEWILRKRMQVI